MILMIVKMKHDINMSNIVKFAGILFNWVWCFNLMFPSAFHYDASDVFPSSTEYNTIAKLAVCVVDTRLHFSVHSSKCTQCVGFFKVGA